MQTFNATKKAGGGYELGIVLNDSWRTKEDVASDEEEMHVGRKEEPVQWGL